jgi:hypothetical protein
MPQKGTLKTLEHKYYYYFFIRFHFGQMARSQADSNTDRIFVSEHAGEGIQDVPRGLQREEQRESHAGQQANGG